jgi:GT2 family glycosyltransferase
MLDIIKKVEQCIENNELEEALNLINNNEHNITSNSELMNLKAIIAIKAGEYSTALECLKSSLEIDKSNIDAYYNMAYAYECLRDYKNAFDTYSYVSNITDDIELKAQVETDIKRLHECEVITINTDNKEAPQPGDNIYLARNNVVSVMLNQDAPLVSVYVLAYNNLEKYTKTCVECVLKYTIDVDYELILVDNGSSDGTLEYFKSVIHPRKKIIKITKNIGPNYGGNAGVAHATGRYIVGIANDVYVTENWLSNMLKCALSDDRIGMINPVSDNISNYQSVNLHYTDFDDMQKKAAEYNISDSRKWEERIRLITIGTLFKRECLDIIGLSDYGFFHDFVDDDVTFRVRRAGYKAILCKDVFVCHAGEITDKGAEAAVQSLKKGKITFKKKYYGIDAWDDVNNYEISMMSLLQVDEIHMYKNAELLGIDVLCGTPLLELKNKLRNAGVYDAKLSAFSREAKYWLDLKTICEGEVKVDRIEYILEHFEKNRFDFIILGLPLNSYKEPYELLGSMLKLLNKGGHLLIKVRNSYDARAFLNILGLNTDIDHDINSCVNISKLEEFLIRNGCCIRNINTQFHQTDENTKEQLMKMVKNCSVTENTNDIFKKMMVREYALNIKKQ